MTSYETSGSQADAARKFCIMCLVYLEMRNTCRIFAGEQTSREVRHFRGGVPRGPDVDPPAAAGLV